ncbi:hypothetical protein [Actinomadura oligospora]|uniref:hypothetical protein n=1 Tax=Actinomadura oligospora TaxID=111804 RepID=UPI00047AB35A|nr:hypothetical protein [Actinomadura oligospora]
MIEIRTDPGARPARIDGGHHPQQTIAIADGIAEATRLLAYATMPDKSGLRHPGDVYSVLGALTDAIARLPQVLTQMTEFIDDGVTEGRVQENPNYGSHGGDAQAAYAEMCEAVRVVSRSLITARSGLHIAHSALSGLEGAQTSRPRGQARDA